jgi:hypothetical protein
MCRYVCMCTQIFWYLCMHTYIFLYVCMYMYILDVQANGEHVCVMVNMCVLVDGRHLRMYAYIFIYVCEHRMRKEGTCPQYYSKSARV